MKRLDRVLQQGKQLRVLGIDDAPFDKLGSQTVNVSGIVCSNTRFEGMLWMEAQRDGDDATAALIKGIGQSKFHEQLHIILLDGIAIGGFNIIDLPILSESLNLPCIAVMRKHPDLEAVDLALRNFEDYERRRDLISKAGEIYQSDDFVYQVAGCTSGDAAQVLRRATDTGKVPEALRLAHLIGSAVKLGESGKRA